MNLLFRQVLAASLALAPCLGWAVDSRAVRPFDDREFGLEVAFSMGHTAPAGRSFADASTDPQSAPAQASILGKSMADSHGARASFASALQVAEPAASIDMGAPVTAVPEPGTYLLTLVGLGAIALVARRRRRRLD
jgi:hypothetical protein